MTILRVLGCALVAQLVLFAALESCATPTILQSGAKGPCGDTDQFCEVCPNGDYCHSSMGGHCSAITGSCDYEPPPILNPIGGARAVDAGAR